MFVESVKTVKEKKLLKNNINPKMLPTLKRNPTQLVVQHEEGPITSREFRISDG
jgi:hypothetical protein